MRGVDLTGGLRDYALALQQQAENEIEYLKVQIPVYATFGKADAVNAGMKRLRYLLGLEAAGKTNDSSEWMNDPKLAKAGMDFLKKMKITIGKA